MSNCPRCQIVLPAWSVSNCPILHDGVKLSSVSNCPRCQIVLLAWSVSNCPRCQIVLGVKLSHHQARVLQVGILIRVLVPDFLCRGRPFLHSWAELQEGGGGFLDNGQHRRFYSLRKAVKSVQILGPSSGGVPIAVCKFCGAGNSGSRDLAGSQ